VLYRVCAAYKYPRVWPRQRSGNCGPSSSSFFCVLRRPTLASLLCRNRLSELLFSRLVFKLQVLAASTSLVSLPLPPSPSVIVFAFAISSVSVTLSSPSSSSTPSTSSSLPPSLLDSAVHLHRLPSLSRRHHLVSSTPQDASRHRCQYTDIYASPVFVIRAFSLVGDVASSPILSLTSLGTFLNSHVDADSTLQRSVSWARSRPRHSDI